MQEFSNCRHSNCTFCIFVLYSVLDDHACSQTKSVTNYQLGDGIKDNNLPDLPRASGQVLVSSPD